MTEVSQLFFRTFASLIQATLSWMRKLRDCVAPRPLYIDVGKADPVFKWQTAQTEFQRAVRYYEAFDASENIRLNVWEGGHTVCDKDIGHMFVMNALGHKI